MILKIIYWFILLKLILILCILSNKIMEIKIVEEITISSIEDFTNFLSQNEGTVTYFSTPQCNVCKVLKPKIIDFINSKFPKVKMGYVNMEHLPEISAQNSIFTVPTILVYLDSKEFLRKSRNINLEDFGKELERPYSLYFE